MKTDRSRRQPPSTAQRVAVGGLLGTVTSFVLSSLLFGGILPSRVAGCALGLVLGAIIYVMWPRVMWAALVAAIVAWSVVAFTPVSRALAAGLVRSDPVPDSVDAVVVLSGSVTDDGMLGPEALDRLLTGLALIRAGKSPTIVITQPHPLANPTVTTARDQKQLISLLPAPPRVVVIDSVVSTRTEALGAARQLPPAGTHTIALVTSPMHTRRACAVFEHVGYNVACVPAQSRDIALRSLSNASDRLAAFRMAASERIAFAVYRRRGWL
ncbi:MAG: YdcF family protein [Gemmatimonadaceae bacterium]